MESESEGATEGEGKKTLAVVALHTLQRQQQHFNASSTTITAIVSACLLTKARVGNRCTKAGANLAISSPLSMWRGRGGAHSVCLSVMSYRK